jgi:hypothetical protein
MFKKIKPGVLMIVLIILLAAYFLVRHFSSNDRTFRDKVLEFDPATVTEVLITVPGQQEQTHLRLEGKEWKVVIRDMSYRADTSNIKSMLSQLSQLATKRFAGKGKEIWKKYELTDSAAVKVEILAGKKEVASLLLGKFDYTVPENQQQQNMRQQQQGEMSTYVRLADEKEVYVVEGFLKMTIGRNGDAFRDKMLTGVKGQDISRVTFSYPGGGGMLLDKSTGKWAINGVPADSMKVVKYLNSISRLTSQDFIYNTPAPGMPSHTVTIEGNNFQPIEIKAFPVADTNLNYLLVSSRNPDAVFNGKKSKLFTKIMVDQAALLPDQGAR